ncbi:MAG: MoaD/ThiS family protein [Thermodesulfobacteriota bacterium]
MQIEVQAYGSLQPALQDTDGSLRNLAPDAELSVLDVLHRLSIAQDQVQLVMLNNRPVNLETKVRPMDRIALFPQEYPVFTDWNDYRHAK